MKSLSFILRSGLMLALCRSVLSMMTANAMRNTVSGDSNRDTSSALQRQYRLANAYMPTQCYSAKHETRESYMLPTLLQSLTHTCFSYLLNALCLTETAVKSYILYSGTVYKVKFSYLLIYFNIIQLYVKCHFFCWLLQK